MNQANKIETTKTFFAAMEKRDWTAVSDLTSENFEYRGSTGEPLNKKTWLEFQQAVQEAFPDWSFNLQDVEAANDEIKVTVHITATHTQNLCLPLHSIPSIPASGKKVDMPEEHGILAFEGDKIVSLKVEKTARGGILGLLEQIKI